jgi:peptidoglycan pentaglycine glycine transferase (the first glycine)
MMTWELLPGSASAEDWNARLAGMPSYSVYQTYEWGEYKRHFGWSPLRILVSDQGRPLSMLQLVKRRFAGLQVLWGSGGPLGSSHLWASTLKTFLQGRRSGPLVYCRLRPAREAAPGEPDFLQSQGWHPSTHRFTSVTLRWDLSPALARLEQGLTRDWRRNLHKARNRGLAVHPWDDPDVDEILGVYRSMEVVKNLETQFSREQLTRMISTFGDKLRLFRCEDHTGRILALRGYVRLDTKAWDMLPATSAEGRKTHASYLLLWALAQECKARGVNEYDLMGIDPIAHPGVYHFKVGTGAKKVEYLGEWEWSNCPLVGRVVNTAMRMQPSI